MPHPLHRGRRAAAALSLVGLLALGACGGSAGSTTGGGAEPTPAAGASSSAGTASGDQVLPVPSNPITNDATAAVLSIDSVLVENNQDAAGAAVDDHLEITVGNTGSTELAGFEVFYTIDDPTAGSSESYYTALPATFTVAPGATRTIHFDSTGAPDHFPVNKYSLYYTSTNAMDVTVEVSATGAAPVTTTVTKDAGGAEVPD